MKDYIKAFSRLRTDKNQKVWTALTKHQAPHKPLLLLSVMDHFAQGVITANLIEPSYELVDTFNTYWAKLQTGRSGNMAYPFPRLKTDGFWHMVANPGYILTFHDRPILLPEEEAFKPARENIEWHRKKRFVS